MFVHPFWVGVATTILVEFGLLIVYAIWLEWKEKK